MKIHRLDHLHIYVVDPEGSARCYTEVFGVQTIGKAQSSYGGAMHFLWLGGVTLVLAPYPAGVEAGTAPPNRDGMYQHGFGIAHFGFHGDDLGEAVESVRRRGGTILSEPGENAGLRFAYIGAPMVLVAGSRNRRDHGRPGRPVTGMMPPTTRPHRAML